MFVFKGFKGFKALGHGFLGSSGQLQAGRVRAEVMEPLPFFNHHPKRTFTN